MPQKLSYNGYTKFAFSQGRKEVEVVGLRQVEYDNVGDVYTPIEGYAIGQIQDNQRLWMRTHDFDADAESFVQVAVLDVKQDGLIHAGSDWMEPDAVDAWIKGQRR
jgi:hypothetical protein